MPQGSLTEILLLSSSLRNPRLLVNFWLDSRVLAKLILTAFAGLLIVIMEG